MAGNTSGVATKAYPNKHDEVDLSSVEDVGLDVGLADELWREDLKISKFQ